MTGLDWAPTPRRRPNVAQEIDLLSKAIAIESSFGSHMALADALIRVERYGEAEHHLREAMAAGPSAAAPWVSLVKVMNEELRFEEAQAAVDTARRLATAERPLTHRFDALAAQTLIGLHRWDHAEELLRPVTERDPRYGPAHRRHTAALFHRGAYDEALDAARRALAADPASTIARAMEQVSLRALGQTHEAFELESVERLLDQGELDLAPQQVVAARRAVVEHPLLRAFDRHGVTDHASRLDDLQSVDDPALVALRESIQRRVDGYVAERGAEGFVTRRPRRVRLGAWGNVFRATGAERPHVHPLGWLSGVCYLGTTAPGDDGAGTLRFGCPPPELADGARTEEIMVVPTPGRCVLFPSWYFHHTTAPGVDDQRVSVAFDVMPVG